ncbi:MAG: RNase adapter RapZ [Peptostreptococcaceae bacterium]|nr:RNase adapter RapZ [Peptostreptococcaceae bacterium]
MRFVIVTGMSGSGKSEVMSVLEDMGYYCIDNLPPELIPKIFELSTQSQGGLENVALGVDVRGYKFVTSCKASLEFIEEQNYPTDILFLDANDDTLVRRYKMTRKRHPLEVEGDVLSGIRKERALLADIKAMADLTLDTSTMAVKELRGRILEIFKLSEKKKNLTVSLTSFGFKHGMPMAADLVFDVRFLPNPYYLDSLREKTGDFAEVREYVMNSPKSIEFLDKLTNMIQFLLPNYEEEGKNHVQIAIGCTGGKHRSVTFVNLLYDLLKDSEYNVLKNHRDIEKR